MKKKLIVFSLIVLMILATFSFSGCNGFKGRGCLPICFYLFWWRIYGL